MAAIEHHCLVFARGQVHPLVMLVNLDWVPRPNFGGAVARIKQARIRMRDRQIAIFNAVAEDHRVQSHAYSYK
jgi:hypothetical protein